MPHVNENVAPVGQSEESISDLATSVSTDQPDNKRRRSLRQPLSRFVAAGPWQALNYRDFRLLWSGQLVSSAGTQMRMVAVAWQVYLLSDSAFQVGALGLFQAIPTMAFSLVGGVIADAVD